MLKFFLLNYAKTAADWSADRTKYVDWNNANWNKTAVGDNTASCDIQPYAEYYDPRAPIRELSARSEANLWRRGGIWNKMVIVPEGRTSRVKM